MIIERTSILTKKIHSLDIDVTPEQIKAWQDGELIQLAMPNLGPDDREFIKTGITAAEWDDHFKKTGQ